MTDQTGIRRGTDFIGDTVRDIRYALRAFKRAPLVAFTIVSTVALGLGMVAVSFTMLNALLFRVDAVPDVHRMFAVLRPTDGRPSLERNATRCVARRTSSRTPVLRCPRWTASSRVA